jgi:hypothetical protein
VRYLPATAPFNNTSLQTALLQMLGIYNGRASAAVGRFTSGAQLQPPSTTDGFLAGIMDLNDGGAVPAGLPVAFAGPSGPNVATFTIAPIGRGTISLQLGTVTYNFVFYLRNTGVGFLLEQPASDGSNRGRSGSFFAQNVTTTGNGTFIGATDVSTAASVNMLAVLPVTVASNAATFQNGTSDTSVLGSGLQSGPISGTFNLTDTTDNRGTATMTAGSLAGSQSAGFYTIDAADVIAVSTDGSNPEPQILGFSE